MKNDFKEEYLGSYFGVTWLFIRPILTILIFWFVFQVGFKAQPVDDFPFILWLISGMIPWFFISDSINKAMNSISQNSFLVKKVVFKVELLPIIKITSELIVHIVFIIFTFSVFYYYSYVVDIYNLQILYYLMCSILFVIAISLFTSSIIIFFKDIGYIVGIFLQFGFWLTPIFWNLNMIPEKYQTIIILNPVYYIIQGFRDSLIYKVWFWEKIELTLYFWFINIFLLILGFYVFKKLRPHFADVL